MRTTDGVSPPSYRKTLARAIPFCLTVHCMEHSGFVFPKPQLGGKKPAPEHFPSAPPACVSALRPQETAVALHKRPRRGRAWFLQGSQPHNMPLKLLGSDAGKGDRLGFK